MWCVLGKPAALGGAHSVRRGGRAPEGQWGASAARHLALIGKVQKGKKNTFFFFFFLVSGVFRIHSVAADTAEALFSSKTRVY